MLKRYFLGLTALVCLLSLSFFVDCGDPEGPESPTIVDTEPTESFRAIRASRSPSGTLRHQRSNLRHQR